MTRATLTDEQRKAGLLDEAVPILDVRVKNEEEAQQAFNEQPIVATLGSIRTYFGPHSRLEETNHVHITLVDWYRSAVELFNGMNGDFMLEDDAQAFYVSFRQSYIGWCQAHGYGPEQDQTWNALYAAISAKGITGFPTLTTFMLNAHE